MGLIRRVQTAVLFVKAQGIPVRRGVWGIEWSREEGRWVTGLGQVCALGAVILHEQPKTDAINELGEMSRLFGVNVSWVMCFRTGFHEWSRCDVQSIPAYRLGAWFAAEYADDLNRI